MNEIHAECTRENAEIFMHQQNDEVIVVVRQFALDYKEEYDAYVSITRFNYYNKQSTENSKPQIELPGQLVDVVFACYLDIPNNTYNNYNSDPKYITGANADFRVYKDLNKFCKVELIGNGKQVLTFYGMPSTFCCVVKTRSPSATKHAVN